MSPPSYPLSRFFSFLCLFSLCFFSLFPFSSSPAPQRLDLQDKLDALLEQSNAVFAAAPPVVANNGKSSSSSAAAKSRGGAAAKGRKRMSEKEEDELLLQDSSGTLGGQMMGIDGEDGNHKQPPKLAANICNQSCIFSQTLKTFSDRELAVFKEQCGRHKSQPLDFFHPSSQLLLDWHPIHSLTHTPRGHSPH